MFDSTEVGSFKRLCWHFMLKMAARLEELSPSFLSSQQRCPSPSRVIINHNHQMLPPMQDLIQICSIVDLEVADRHCSSYHWNLL